MPTWVPGPIRLWPRPESPFQAADKRQIVQRVDAAIAESQMIGELKAGREPMVNRILYADADRERPQIFVPAVTAIRNIVDPSRSECLAANTAVRPSRPKDSTSVVAPHVHDVAAGLVGKVAVRELGRRPARIGFRCPSSNPSPNRRRVRRRRRRSARTGSSTRSAISRTPMVPPT